MQSYEAFDYGGVVNIRPLSSWVLKHRPAVFDILLTHMYHARSRDRAPDSGADKIEKNRFDVAKPFRFITGLKMVGRDLPRIGTIGNDTIEARVPGEMVFGFRSIIGHIGGKPDRAARTQHPGELVEKVWLYQSPLMVLRLWPRVWK